MLEAKVIRKLNATRHHVLNSDGSLTDIAMPEKVRIVQDDVNSYFLLHLDRDGQCIADTWHPSLPVAKKQAEFEFGIKGDEWSEVSLS